MPRKMKYAAGTLLQYSAKAIRRSPEKMTPDAILVVFDRTSMFEGNRHTGHIDILDFYKSQDCFVVPYDGPTIDLWTTENDICSEFDNEENRPECREFCHQYNIQIR